MARATMKVETTGEGGKEAILVAEGPEGLKVDTPIARLAGPGDRPAATRSGQC